MSIGDEHQAWLVLMAENPVGAALAAHLLRRQLQAARVAIAEADRMRATVPGHSGGDCVETGGYDAARAAFREIE